MFQGKIAIAAILHTDNVHHFDMVKAGRVRRVEDTTFLHPG